MDRRSTNTKGFVHFGGDVRSGAQDGIGVNLGSASTGSTAWIEAISDDTNANIGLRGQGTGTISLGNSSQSVVAPGGVVAGSFLGTAGGLYIKAAYSTTFNWTLNAISSGQTLEVTLTTAVGGAVPIAKGDLMGHLSLNCTNAQVGVNVNDIRWSTVATSVVTITVGNITSTATSTLAGIGFITWLDLT